MDGMKKWLAPIGIFAVGMIGILVVTIFFPSIGTQTSTAVSNISGSEMSAFTGLHWGLTSIRLIIYFGLFAAVLVLVAVAWLKRK